MKCPYCNQEIEDGIAVCPICGKELVQEQPAADEAAAAPAAEETAETTETTESDAVSGSAEAAPVSAGTQTAEAAAPSGNTAEGPAESTESETSAGEPVSLEAEKKPGKKKTGIIAAIIALVVVIGAAAALFPKKNSKDIVIDAFKSITASGQTSPMEEIFGWKEMGEKLNTSSSEVNFELALQDSSDPTLQQLATGKIGMTALNDVENKKMSFIMGVGYADMNIANLECYLDEKQLVVAIPELSAKAFALNYSEDLEGQIANSPYLGQILTDSGMDMTGLNNYLAKCNELAANGNQLFDLKELWNRYKEGSKAIDDLKAAMTVEKADKKDFTIDGASQSCQGYNATITKDALIQFLTTSKEFFLQDETLKKDFVEYMSLVNELQSTMTALYGASTMTPEEMQEELWQTAEEQFNLVLEQLKESMGDVALTVYVRKDGKMASFDYSTTAKISDEDIKIYGTVTFAGGYSMMANVQGTVNMEDSTGAGIVITLDKTGAYEAGKSLSGGLNATIDIDGDTYGMVTSGDYSVEDGTFNLSADFQADGQSGITLTSSGIVQNLVKGESLELTFDSIKGQLGLVTGMDDYIDLSGFYKVGPLVQTVEVPEGETIDILAADEDDWNAVFSEIMGNVYGLMMSFYQ